MSLPLYSGMAPIADVEALAAAISVNEQGRLSTRTQPDVSSRSSVNSRLSHHRIQIGGSQRSSVIGAQSKLGERVQPLELVFRDLTFAVKKKDKRKWWGKKNKEKSDQTITILKHLNGMFRAGRMTAIMGPSGAGKTSLLDSIAGNLLGGQISGQVLVNGQDYTGKKIKKISGFVFQDDVLLPTMNVREAIEQSAILRLPKSVSRKERKQRVEDIISLLHLESCQNICVGSATTKGISGGERKRTSTAMELIANPPMLFLDEPTSGLDTFTAFTVIKSLSKLTKRGCTVITTIHQPSSEIFHLFDDILLLADGNIVFYGPAKDSIDYFARLGYPCPQYSNPADFYSMEILRPFEVEGLNELRRRTNPELAAQLEEIENANRLAIGTIDGGSTISEVRINRLTEAWKNSPENQRMQEAMENGRKEGVAIETLRERAPIWTQFTYLFKRASKNSIRDPLVVLVQLFRAVYLGLVVGLIYLNTNQYDILVQLRNKSGAIYFLALNVFYSSVYGVLTIFYVEKQVVFREYKAGYYTTTPYFFSKFLVEMPYSFLFPYLMVIIAYYMVGLNPAFSAYLMTATFTAFASVAGVALGVLIASIFDDFEIALTAAPIILLPLLIFSGIFAASDGLPDFLNWIKYTSPIYYANLGMLQSEFSREFPNCDPNDFDCRGSPALDSLGFGGALPMGVNFVLLVAIWLILTMAAYIALLIVVRIRYRSA